MKKKYYHQKLIRDKIPRIIKASGNDYKTRVLNKGEFEKELKRKLVEESKELVEAPKEELLNELADVLELTKSVASYYKIPFSKVEKFQEKKERKEADLRKSYFLFGQPVKQESEKVLDRSATGTQVYFLFSSPFWF